MRPDRILIGEIRDVEVMDMLQAMNTGHDGSMGTIHANNPRDCLGRLELLAGFAGFQGSERTLRHNIVSAVDLIVQLERLASGERRVTSVSELITVGEGQYQLEELHRFDELSGKHVESLARPIRPRLKEAVRADATKRASTGAALGLGGVRYV
jgi:pilus assembly protein CpaF